MAVTMVALGRACGRSRNAAGVITSVEKFFGDLPPDEGFHIPRPGDPPRSLLIAAVLACSSGDHRDRRRFYNLFAELFGYSSSRSARTDDACSW